MKYTIEPVDFDEAVKQPWRSDSCLLAQAGNRIGIPLYDNDGIRRDEWPCHGESYRLQGIFDTHFRTPGDEKKPELVALRASLPIEINLP